MSACWGNVSTYVGEFVPVGRKKVRPKKKVEGAGEKDKISFDSL